VTKKNKNIYKRKKLKQTNASASKSGPTALLFAAPCLWLMRTTVISDNKAY